jgi:peptide chain release factor 1
MARLYEFERQKVEAQRTAARNVQIGTGGRSEKIRTYRWKEGIAADERLPGEYQLRDLLAGDFAELMRDLVKQETARRVGML